MEAGGEHQLLLYFVAEGGSQVVDHFGCGQLVEGRFGSGGAEYEPDVRPRRDGGLALEG